MTQNSRISICFAVLSICILFSVLQTVFATPLPKFSGGVPLNKSIKSIRLTDEEDWISCINITVLGQTCVEFYAIPENLTVGVKLTIRNITFLNEEIEGNHICLSDTSLLSLLELIPVLAPFKPIIDAIIKADKYIPAHILSICLDLTNVVYNSTDFSACADLDSRILCFEDSCVYKGNDSFGCFDIPV